MAASNQETVITYGSYSVGGDTGRPLDGPIVIEESFDSVSISFSFLVQDDNETTFLAAEASARAALRTPRQNLSITQNGATLYTFSQSSNTWFDADPRISTPRDPAQTGRSRIFQVTISAGMPADVAGLGGRQKTTIRIEYTSSRKRKVTIAGTYTAISSSNAQAVYDGAISAYCASVLSSLSITASELSHESAEYLETLKTIDFSRVYDELFINDAGGSGDVSAIVSQQLQINRTRESPGDYTEEITHTGRLNRLNAKYSCAVDHNESTDLEGLYTGTLRSWIVGRVMSLFTGQLALIQESPSYDQVEHTITVSLVFEGAIGGKYIEYKRVDESSYKVGTTLLPVWDESPFARLKYSGPGALTHTITQDYITTGEPEPFSSLWEEQNSNALMSDTETFNGPDGSDLTWVYMGTTRQKIPTTRGLEGYQFSTTGYRYTHNYEAAKIVTIEAKEFTE